MLFLDLAPPTLQNSGIFFTIAPVLTSTLTICRRIAAIRRLYIGLRVRFTSIKNIVVLVWPGAAHMPIAV